MKKIVYIMVSALLGVGLWSCGSSDERMDMNTAQDEVAKINKMSVTDLKTQTDSLSYYLGFNEGAAVAMNTESLPEYVKENYTSADYLTGVTAVLKSDTTKLGYTDGINEGLRLLQVVLDLEHHGVTVDRQLLLDAMEQHIMADSINEDTMTATAQMLDSLVTVARTSVASYAPVAEESDNEQN